MPDTIIPPRPIPEFKSLNENARFRTELLFYLEQLTSYYEYRLKTSVEQSETRILQTDIRDFKGVDLIGDLVKNLVGSDFRDSILEGQGTGTGDIESVLISVPAFMTGGGSYSSGAASFNLSFNNQDANKILSGPTSGGPGVVDFRLLVLNDLPISGRLDRTSSAADPTNIDLPTLGQASIHRNTVSGNIFLAYNNGGVIVKIQLV